MSQLYFTSSLISNTRFLTLEQLFTSNIEIEDTLLVFDTNLVIYFRDLYLNPYKFILNAHNKDIYESIRYLIEQINRYDLLVDASIGVDESSRRLNDFSMMKEKAEQTQNALLNLFKMDIQKLDEFIKTKEAEEPIITHSQHTLSKIKHLNQECVYKNILTVSYLYSLKIYHLYFQIQNKSITPINAYVELHNYMTKEIDCVGGTMLMFALHLFGGVEVFKSIIISKKNEPLEIKLHKIFNGAIDLIYPYMVNKIPDIFFKDQPNLIPVFVTLDQRLSTLHSLINTKMKIEELSTEHLTNYNPELIELNFFSKMSWTEKEFEIIRNLNLNDFKHRIQSAFSGPREMEHLLPIVEKLEVQVIETCF